jgi:putative endonuclease
MKYFVYIMAHKPYGVLYTGITNDLIRRVYEHKDRKVEDFTKKYHLKMLVYYEGTDDVQSSLQREKTLKHWTRKWKIEKMNPEWRDLYDDLV